MRIEASSRDHEGAGPLTRHPRSRRSRSKADLPIRFSRLVRPDLDRDFPVEAFEKVQKFVRREPAEVPIHQVRHFRLRDPQETGNLALFSFLSFSIL